MGRLLHCLVVLWITLCSTAAASEEGKNWCYLSQKCHDPTCEEPRNWNHLFGDCGKDRQSPINIVTSKVQYNWELTPFCFENYDAKQHPTNWTVKNNGHSVEVKLDGTAKVASGGLTGKYKAMQFHFHWGNDESRGNPTLSSGSEHSIDGERYAMELHIVHIKDEFASIEEALPKKGLAVLGFFIEVGQENQNYKPLLSSFQNVRFKGDATGMVPLSLSSLIPEKGDLTSYYRYTGSLTTPSCNEDVEWTLFEKPIQLGLHQIQEFWMKLYFGNSTDWPMVDNFRHAQPLGERIVFKSESNALLPPAKALLLIPTVASLALALIQ